MLLTSTEKKWQKRRKNREKEEKKLRKLIEAEIKSKELKDRKRRANKPIYEVKILKRKKTLTKSKNDEEDTECAICTELFSQSVEDWLQCEICHKWARESCANLEAGKFVCEFCQ